MIGFGWGIHRLALTLTEVCLGHSLEVPVKSTCLSMPGGNYVHLPIDGLLAQGDIFPTQGCIIVRHEKDK